MPDPPVTPPEEIEWMVREHKHLILLFDGGSDHLLPGRWAARYNTMIGPIVHGATAAEAIANLRAVEDAKVPPWYRNLRVVRVH
jgi:hypothetical protein